jgi:hypothetical protein
MRFEHVENALSCRSSPAGRKRRASRAPIVFSRKIHLNPLALTLSHKRRGKNRA